MRFVVLDDLVLVARKRRRNAGGANSGADEGSVGGGIKLAITPLLGPKLSTLTSLPTIRKSTVVFLISLLLHLKAGPAARSTFLDMRTKVLKAHVRKIRFEGHVGVYVGDLAVVYFTDQAHGRLVPGEF